MNVLVTGAGGQLGFELARACPHGVNVTAADKHTCDITDDARLRSCVQEAAPDVIVNAAAYTAVDRAETDRETARAINVDGPENLAKIAAQSGIRLIHISTDFVFDGESGTAYHPEDKTNPLCVYGLTKRNGEIAVMTQAGQRATIIRTAWLYSVHGHNFVKRMLELMRERDSLRVVCDQVSTPTWAADLAHTIWQAVRVPEMAGIHHFTDAGVASWYDFAVAIHEEARATGLLRETVDIEPITSSQYPTPARRPSYSVLDSQATWRALGGPAKHWRESLRHMLSEMQ